MNKIEKPNRMQQSVIDSEKRIIVITAQAGSGSTTALLMKLAEEATKNKNNLGIFVERTSKQIHSIVQSVLRNSKNARYSPESSILTFKHNNKKVKIKMVAYDYLDKDNYIPVVAIDHGTYFKDISDILNIAGKVIISDFVSNILEQDSWAYKSGLLKDVNGKPEWSRCVDNIKGYNYDNPGLPESYRGSIEGLSYKNKEKLLRVDF